MRAYKLAEIWLFPLRCGNPQCGKDFQEHLARLVSRDAIPCPHCGFIVDLTQHKRAIEDDVRVAAEIDKMPGEPD